MRALLDNPLPDGPHRMSFYALDHFHGARNVVIFFFPPPHHNFVRFYSGANAIIVFHEERHRKRKQP